MYFLTRPQNKNITFTIVFSGAILFQTTISVIAPLNFQFHLYITANNPVSYTTQVAEIVDDTQIERISIDKKSRTPSFIPSAFIDITTDASPIRREPLQRIGSSAKNKFISSAFLVPLRV